LDYTELRYFELLKSKIQAKYLETHFPSEDNISRWKGIDIIYFQEDLRKKAKGNISEKSFYTYFKTFPITKLPRIDMLNLLCAYIGYKSWYDFKKNNEPIGESENINFIPEIKQEKFPKEIKKHQIKIKNISRFIKKYLWIGISIILFILIIFLSLYDAIFTRTYTFEFMDADRNWAVQSEIEIMVIKQGESPLFYRVKPSKKFIYKTKDKSMKMVVKSVFYKTDTVVRNLSSTRTPEVIMLKPNEYNMMLYSYSRSKDFKNRRTQLERLIRNDAIIYQVFDNKYFNVEVMSKQRYINFLSLPTTSLENLHVIETKIENGKVVLIKFRIENHE